MEIDPLDTPEPFGLVVQMRIYDVLMALLTLRDEQVAEALAEAHAAGKIIGSFPFMDMGE